MATLTLKQIMIVAATAAALAGCSSTPKVDPAAEQAAAEKAAAEKASVEKAAADKAAAEKAAADKAAEEAKARAVGGTTNVTTGAGEAKLGAAPAPTSTTLKTKGHFDFNKSVLRGDAKAALDKDIVEKKAGVKAVKSVQIGGHADRIGSQEYNQKLSEKRAEAVKAYLVGKGVPADSVETTGFGKTQPATGVPACDDKLPRAKLIECLQPHRRAEVELKGEAK